MKLTKTLTRFLRKNAGTLLAVAASVGVVATAIETGKATIKAEKLVELNKDIPEYDTRQKVLDCWHFYIPAAVVGAGTIGCIVGANMLSRKEIARLSAAYMALGKTYQEYRRQVAERIGREEEQQLHASVAEEVKRDKDGDVIRLFYEPATKRYFHATMADVTQASYWFNRELMTEGYVSVNLKSLNAIAGLLASFGCDRQAGCVLYIQHKIAKAMEADERKCRNEKHV